MASGAIHQPAPLPGRSPVEEPLYEVVNGQRVELPPMGAYATWIASRLNTSLDVFAGSRQLGTVVAEMLFILKPPAQLKRRPDVAFVSAERWPLDQALPETGDWELVPDLAVEVVSPHDLFQDVLGKMDEYFQAGTQQVWIVVPAKKQVYVFSSPTQVRILSVGDELDGGTLLPGFRLPVAQIFSPQVNA